MGKLFYSISEAADICGENISTVRFWTNSFSRFIRPGRNTKGNRQYTSGDIETLKQIRFLVKDRGLTLEGASRELSESGKSVEARVKALDTLKDIRDQLVEIRKTL